MLASLSTPMIGLLAAISSPPLKCKQPGHCMTAISMGAIMLGGFLVLGSNFVDKAILRA